MPKQYIDDLNNIYNEDIVLPTKPGPGAQELEQHGSEGSTGKVFDDGGPANADGFHTPELDPKKKKDDSSYEEDKYSNTVSKESVKNIKNLQENDQEEINNFTMSDKSTFDKLFEDVMGEADFELPAEDLHDGMDLDMDPEGDEEGGDDGDLKSKVQSCIETLQEVLDTMDDDAGEAGDDMEDLEDANNPFEEEVEHEDHGHALVNAKSGHAGGDNKVAGAADPTPGSADAKATAADGGDPKPAKDGVPHNTKAKTAGNHKVGAKL